MLSIPAYIERARIASREPRYPYDEWNIRALYQQEASAGPVDEESDPLFERLLPLSRRAKIALTIACAEWVVFRYQGVLSDDPVPLQFLEAAWAGEVHPAYTETIETDDDEWRGPVRGVLNMAITLVDDALFGHDDEDDVLTLTPRWVIALARNTLPNSDAFNRWLEAVVTRLEESFLAPEDAEDDLFGDTDAGGTPVPREAFDADRPLVPAAIPQLISRFLEQLDPRRNPFLKAPEEVAAFPSFQGSPYEYP